MEEENQVIVLTFGLYKYNSDILSQYLSPFSIRNITIANFYYSFVNNNQIACKAGCIAVTSPKGGNGIKYHEDK